MSTIVRSEIISIKNRQFRIGSYIVETVEPKSIRDLYFSTECVYFNGSIVLSLVRLPWFASGLGEAFLSRVSSDEDADPLTSFCSDLYHGINNREF